MVFHSLGSSFILERLQGAGYEAFLVGGTVRDALMGRPSGDVDIATSATPSEVRALFMELTVIDTGLPHGTVTVVVNREAFEVTTYRVDFPSLNHRHPSGIRYSLRLCEDLARRDFTINAMAWNPDVGLVDLFGGQADVSARLVRCVGDAMQRFNEDGLRILRALRFASVLDFRVEDRTAEALRRRKNLLTCLSMERIVAELTKLLCGTGVGAVLRQWFDVLTVVLPELTPLKGARGEDLSCDLWEQTVRTVEVLPDESVLRWAALLHSLSLEFSPQDQPPLTGAVKALNVMRRLKMDGKTRDGVAQLLSCFAEPLEATPRNIKQWLARLTPHGFSQLLTLKRAIIGAVGERHIGSLALIDEAKALAQTLLAQSVCFSLKDLSIAGRDLIVLGYHPGPELGKTLNWLLELVIDEKIPNEAEPLREAARQRLANSLS